MIKRCSFIVEECGVRLDAAVLSLYPSTTRAFVREAIASGHIVVNGKSAIKGMKLKAGDTVSVAELLEASDNLVKPNPAIRPRIVFEDDSIVACNKPAGIPVQPLTCGETETLANGIAAKYPECIPIGDRPLMAGAVHRIDADTSGLVIFARTAEAFEAMRAQFAAQTVEKTYLALVEGAVSVGGTLENDLIHDPSLPFCKMIDISRLRVNPKRPLKPLHAATQFVPIAHTCVENEERTLLEVHIKTGVTHQIRAQLAIAGMHIVNDRLYGAFAVEGQRGHCLHALAASFTHPSSSLPVEIHTEYPDWAYL